MRVLLVFNRPESSGGGEVSFMLLAEALAASGEVEPVVTVPMPGAVAEQAAALGLPVHTLPLPRLRTAPWRWFGARSQARRVVDSLSPDLVHCNGSRAMLLAGTAAVGLGIPVVWHVRVEGSDRLDRRLAPRADRIVVPSGAVARRFEGDEVRVVPNPVRPPALPAEGLRAHVAPDADLLLCAVGEITPNKGYDRLLQAFARLPGRDRARLLIVGGPDPAQPGEQDRLERLSSDLGLSGQVVFTGYRPDAGDLIGVSDLLVLASDREGFGRVYVEALARGVRVVATPSGGPREIHERTGLGVLASDHTPRGLAEAILRCLSEPGSAERHAVEGPAAVEEHFSPRAHAEAMLRIYKECLS